MDYILINDHFVISDREKRLFKLARKEGTKIIVIGHHQTLTLSGHAFHFMSVDETTPSSNNGSMVLSVRLGGESWLFTGDLEKEGEQALLRQEPGLKADILKIGHHGSKTSTTATWLKALNPKLALISVGKNNRYGHPSPEVVNRLNKNHIPILETDKRGGIEIKFKDGSLYGLKTAK